MLQPGIQYALFITPACGNNCDPIQGVAPLIVPFTVPGVAPPAITTMDITATNCDMVIVTADVGLDPDTDYQFSHESSDLDFVWFRQNGELLFYFDEPYPWWHNGFLELDQIQYQILNQCPDPIAYPSGNVVITEDDERLLDFNIINPFPLTSCTTQPIPDLLGPGEELTRLDFLRCRIAPIDNGDPGNSDDNELDDFIARMQNNDVGFENPLNRGLLDANSGVIETSQFGPQVPVLSIPFDYTNSAEQCFVMNIEVGRQVFNQAHPFANDQYCTVRYNTDLVLICETPPIQNCDIQPAPEVTGINFCVDGQDVNADLFINRSWDDISHVEYRYRLEGGNVWSDCMVTSEPFIAFTDSDLYTNGDNMCDGNVIIQARVVCECGAQACEIDWDPAVSNIITNEYTSAVCGPPAPVNPNPDVPEFFGADHCGEFINVDYYLIPGVHAYRAFYRELTAADVFTPEARIECVGNWTCNVDGAPQTMFIPPIQGQTTQYVNQNDCPEDDRTIRIPGTNPNSAYRVYVQSLCCDDGQNPQCNSNGPLGLQESECYLVMDVPGSCGMDTNQDLIIDVLNTTTFELQWDDPSNEDEIWIATATPVSPCNGLPIRTEIVEQGPSNQTRIFELDGLIPGVEYQVSLSKDCSGITCTAATSTFEITNALPNPTTDEIDVSSSDICPDEKGEIQLFLPQQNFSIYELNNGQQGIPNDVTNILTFEILNEGVYQVQVLGCPEKSYEFVVEELCIVEIDFLSGCKVEADYDCGANSLTSWEYSTDGQNGWSEVTGENQDVLIPEWNGFYRYIIDHPTCGIVESESLEISCVDVDLGFDCEGDPSMTTYFIDATLTDMNKLSDWVNTNVPNGFLPLPSQTLNNTNLVIKGFLEIDIPFNLTDCQVDFESPASLIVSSTLSGFDTEFNSCTSDYWSGIDILDSGTVNLGLDSKIIKAWVGLHLSTNSTVNVRNTTFDDNKFGISLLSGTDMHLGGTFASNTFIARDGFQYGIWAWHGDIIEYNSDGGQSTFRDYFSALKVTRNASLTVSNVKLIDSNAWIDDGALGFNLSDADFESNGTDRSYILLRDSPNLVSALDNLTIQSNDWTSISVRDCAGATLTMDGISTESSSTGIYLGSSAFTSCDISDIDINGGESGIRLYDCSNVEILGGNIYNLDNPWPQGQSVHFSGHGGVQARLATNIEIQDITVNQIGDYVHGVRAHSCTDLSLRDNTIDIDNSKSGFNLVGCENNFICGNELNNSRYGSFLYNSLASGNNQAVSYIQNEHSNNLHSIDVRVSDIGLNAYAGNLFDNTGSYLDASITNPDQNTFEINDGDNKPDSVNPDPAILNDWFFDDPLNSGATSNVDCESNDPVNIKKGGKPPVDCCCPATPTCPQCCPDPVYPDCEEMIRLLQSVLNGQSISTLSPASLYSYRLSIIQRYLSHLDYPELIPEIYKDCLEEYEGMVEGYAESEMNNDMIVLATAKSKLAGLTENDDVLSNTVRQQNALFTEKQKAFIIAESSVDKEDLRNEILTIQKNLIALKNLKLSREQRISKEVFSHLDAIVIPDNPDSYYSKMLEIQAYLLRNDVSSMSPDQLADINHIAHKCAHEFGRPVYFSRILLEEIGGAHVDSYDDDLICTGRNEDLRGRDRKVDTNSDISVYPNPSSGIVTISGEKLSYYEIVTVMDITGKVVHDEKIEDGISTKAIDLRSLNAGVYILSVGQSEDKQQFKIVLLE